MEYTIWICFIILSLAKVHDQEIVDVSLTLCIRQLLRFCSNQQRLEFESMTTNSEGHLNVLPTVLWINSCRGSNLEFISFLITLQRLPENLVVGMG